MNERVDLIAWFPVLEVAHITTYACISSNTESQKMEEEQYGTQFVINMLMTTVIADAFLVF